MKNLHLAVIVAVCVWTNVIDCKTQRINHQIKKATAHLKPTKGPKVLLENFKTLPADDFEFIKQLDKQFKQFGNNIQIMLQKENRTTTGKNIKRTIDGSLGYGYQNPHDQQMMYSFSKPKYEIYPYSQHDIAPSSQYQDQQHQLHYLRNYPMALVESDPDYFRKQTLNGHTSVEIQPSHSYEIKQTGHGYRTIYPGHNDEHSQDYGGHSDEAVPVIVLRYNGPAKYASHLQVLLQQYLEARTAQYIQSLQEQEAHGIDDSQQIHDQEQNVNAYGALPVLPYSQSAAYAPAQMFIQPVQQIQPFFSQPLSNPYASAHIAQPIDIGADHVVATPAPANYYTPAQSDETHDQHSGVVHQTAYEYHNVHDVQQQQQQQHSAHDTHSNEEVIYGQPQHESVSEHDGLLTTENFPDDKHTQVFFKSSTQSPYQSHDHYSQPISQQYLPQTYRAPLVYHKFEEESYYPQGDQGDGYSGYDDNAQPIGGSTPYSNTVAITQRPAILPHNYHAHMTQSGHYNNGYDYSTESSEDNNLYKRSSNRKRQSTQNREDQMKKFKRLANRMKSRMAAAKQTNPEQVQV